ncbi:4a-hydroxytetrahydrobiopterin dehydratase [Xaviernesmea oryzae]|uniref:Putative pterin-4-alpha-carbinolamine dehydratase n=1 Tax=Xaviernesmea oryzae TaxID=464029 RepID=A0A1Q9AXP1_9HYPH|nr:4a-hydroxytetrahydrobiopterin dehydratase [Xaviernesmea oryzae]OLP60232.1 4a-hydroxytetrahydrobiopterin dehydratase [Xaviernesmea oryzae]SEK27240.1 4a-hydroxytetrahydrobiopterin dehydratase [Xaviernesmea oryzae]
MSRKRLDEHEVAAGLAALNAGLDPEAGWSLDADGLSIIRAFRFKSFEEAFAFMTQSALVCARIDHHPDWSNSYNRVHVRLTTHSAKGLTALDLELAAAMNAAVRLA